ncbi:MAG: 3'-5' exonuclease [Chloroflexi bacterium]|nr:3'-5' exonuclease [Chloroflexota bacterium]
MEALEAFLQPGRRALAADGTLLPRGEQHAGLLGGALLVVDLEMSGPHPREHEVIDIGGVLADVGAGFPEQGSWGARVRPLHIGTAQTGALKVAGYSARKWRDAAPLEEAFARVVELGQGAALAGWGITSDMAFLAETARRTETPWPFADVALDVQLIARKLLGRNEVDRFNLGHVADRLGIGRLGEHTALADAYATYDVLVKLAERAGLGGNGGGP